MKLIDSKITVLIQSNGNFTFFTLKKPKQNWFQINSLDQSERLQFDLLSC